jgi:membrane protein insertase Oxa1/YidC/SpoIIIJ
MPIDFSGGCNTLYVYDMLEPRTMCYSLQQKQWALANILLTITIRLIVIVDNILAKNILF